MQGVPGEAGRQIMKQQGDRLGGREAELTGQKSAAAKRREKTDGKSQRRKEKRETDETKVSRGKETKKELV